jgi:hypothetical protein
MKQKKNNKCRNIITTKLTKLQLEYEIITLANNIQVFKSMDGDVNELLLKLADYHVQLYELNAAELNSLMPIIQN